jgi:5-formyltetrahydrofolate cyclo-ligase
MNKKELRDWLRKRRQSLSEAEWQERNDGLLALLHAEILSIAPKYIHFFLPLAHHKEPDIRPLIPLLPHTIQWMIPAIHPASKSMSHYFYHPDMPMLPNAYGISEPDDTATEANPALVDLVLVPMLGFDLQGQRIGFGGGYYDRFLSTSCNPQAKKIGLSLLPPVVGLSFAESHDVPLDAVVTPYQVYRFSFPPA